jgi:hypothetical protein
MLALPLSLLQPPRVRKSDRAPLLVQACTLDTARRKHHFLSLSRSEKLERAGERIEYCKVQVEAEQEVVFGFRAVDVHYSATSQKSM